MNKVAWKKRSLVLGVTSAIAAGYLLGTLAAAGQPDHHLEIVLPASSSAQSLDTPDALAPVSGLVGRWTGTTEGQPGKGTVEREYERVLGGRFIQVRNRSTYPAQDKNPKGEVHEDIGFFSVDRARRTLVFRQFHVEGFVNQFVRDPSSTAGRIVLTTESIENIPAGWRARETYILTGADQLEEIFELAEPGKDFAAYSRSRLSRVK